VSRVVTNFQLSGEFVNLPRDVDRVLAAVQHQLGDIRWPRPTSSSRCCPVLVLPEQGRLRGGQDHQRLSPRRRLRCRSCTTSQGQFVHRRGAVRRGRPADAVQLRAGLLPGRHGGAQRPTCSSCARIMPRKPRAEIYTALGLQKQGKNAVLPRLPAPPSATAPTSSASRPASRAW
jgi:isocitrate dehydrogenase kinase/phosphatase